MAPKKVFTVENLSVYAGPWKDWEEAWKVWTPGTPGYFLALAPESFFTNDAQPQGEVWVVEGESLRIPPDWKRAKPLPTVPFNGPRDAEGMVINWPDMETPPLSPEDWTWIANIFKGLTGPLYVGCGAGRGRTGTALAILAGLWGLTKTPIAYVREHYYEEAVETPEQEDYVAKITGLGEHI